MFKELRTICQYSGMIDFKYNLSQKIFDDLHNNKIYEIFKILYTIIIYINYNNRNLNIKNTLILSNKIFFIVLCFIFFRINAGQRIYLIVKVPICKHSSSYSALDCKVSFPCTQIKQLFESK